MMAKAWQFLACMLASGFFTSYPFYYWKSKRFHHSGAGFVGTLFGVACVPLLPEDILPAAFTLLGAIFLSIGISDIAEEALGQKDDSRIIIDEWVGYLCAVILLPKTIGVLIAAFVLFRCLDVFKPFGIARAAGLPGGLGVVLDDVLAGFVANALLRAGLFISHFLWARF